MNYLIIYVATSYLIMSLIGLLVICFYNYSSQTYKEKHPKLEKAVIQVCLLAPVAILFVPSTIYHMVFNKK